MGFFLVGGMVLVAVGVVMLVQARGRRRAGSAFLRGSAGALARVVDVREKYPPRTRSDDMSTFHPVVAFELPDGRRVDAEVMVGARPAPARVGDTVEVRYDPADPGRVALAHGLATVGAESCFATALAVSLCVVGGFVLVVCLLLLGLGVPWR